MWYKYKAPESVSGSPKSRKHDGSAILPICVVSTEDFVYILNGVHA